MPSKAAAQNFYVYQYVRSRESARGKAGTPYYVGKGRGRRATDNRHSIPVPSNSDRIVIVASHMSESDAFQLEVFLIYLYGRIDIGTGCLRNKTAGGEGVTGFKASEETRAKLREVMSRKRGPMDMKLKIKLSLIKKGKPSLRLGIPHTEASIQKMKDAHRAVAERKRQKVIDEHLNAFYDRIAMKQRANHATFTPATAQPTQGNDV